MYITRPERCTQKMAYTAECVATSAALALSWVGLVLYPYECDVCRYWHLTHYPQPVPIPAQRTQGATHDAA